MFLCSKGSRDIWHWKAADRQGNSQALRVNIGYCMNTLSVQMAILSRDLIFCTAKQHEWQFQAIDPDGS